MSGEIPLFPLRTVLFPEGPLPLRIFEARYLDMVSRCMRGESAFGVLLLMQDSAASGMTTAAVGTLARITDWYQGSDGLLGITATGIGRFRLLSERRQADGLHVGRIEELPEPAARPLPEEFKPMAVILEAIIEDLGKLYAGLPRRYDDAGWVGNRFAEILPIAMEIKQSCLECEDPLERLSLLRPMLKSVRWQPSQ